MLPDAASANPCLPVVMRVGSTVIVYGPPVGAAIRIRSVLFRLSRVPAPAGVSATSTAGLVLLLKLLPMYVEPDGPVTRRSRSFTNEGVAATPPTAVLGASVHASVTSSGAPGLTVTGMVNG